MNNFYYFKIVYLSRFLSMVKDLRFLKNIVGILLIAIGIFMIKYLKYIEISSIIAGTGFALLISGLFEYFESRKKEIQDRKNYLDNLSGDIEKCRFYAFSKQFKEDIISRLLYLNSRPMPPFLRDDGSIGIHEAIREMAGDGFLLDKRNKFVLEILINISFSSMIGIHGRKIKKFLLNPKKLENIMAYQLQRTLKSIFWSAHHEKTVIKEFIIMINKNLKDYLEVRKDYIDPKIFIDFYEYISKKLISVEGISIKKPLFKKKGKIYIYEGNLKSFEYSIRGLENIGKIFIKSNDLVLKKINLLKKEFERASRIKKFNINNFRDNF